MITYDQPYARVCIDIETGNADPADAESWMRRFWSPSPGWKPATIGARWLEALEKKKERLALLDSSPILCLGIKTDRDLRCLHSMGRKEPRLLCGGLVEGFANERDMLKALRNLLDAQADEGTALIGHNIRDFDLPKLRNAFLRNGLNIPVPLVNREQPIFDTMKEYYYGFTLLDKQPMISLADLADVLKVPHHKWITDGDAIPALAAAGRVDDVIAYTMLDVLLEHDIFLRMTGQGQDQEQAAQVDSNAARKAVPA
jgi:hypothetical protein